MMRRPIFPISMVFFLLQAIVILLQIMPVINLVMLLTLSMYWPAFFINAGMIGIAVEVVIGRVLRFWMIIPLMFYGAYYAVAIPQQYEASLILKADDDANARVAIPFESKSEALILSGYLRSDILVRDYALPVVYTTSSDGDGRYRSVRRFKHTECERLESRLPKDVQGVSLQWLDAEGEATENRDKGMHCLFQMPEAVELPKLFATSSPKAGETKDFDASELNVEIKVPDGRTYELAGGIARPLPWIPAPAIWCGPSLDEVNDEKWACSVKMAHEGDGRGWLFAKAEVANTRRLAKSLRLLPAQATGGEARGFVQVLTSLEAFREAEAAGDLARLDALIANHTGKSTSRGLAKLSAYPDKLASRAEGIAMLLEHEVKTAHPTAFGEHSVAELAAALPEREFTAMGPRILALYAGAGEGHWLWNSYTLIGRLGTLGPAALPVLTSPHQTRSFYGHGWIEGICRVGAQGRQQAEPILLKQWKNGSGDPAARTLAVYIAMRRSGIVPPPLDDFQQARFGPFLEKWSHISPNSPPSVCTAASTMLEEKERREAAQRKAEFFRRNHGEN